MSILPKACVCGHDHETIRGERVHLCLDCSCDDYGPRCQNCGDLIEGWGLHIYVPGYDTCSRRCALQIEHALRCEDVAA